MSSGTGNPISAMFRAFKRVFVWLGFAIEDATQSDALDEATIQSEINKSKQKANQAQTENGRLAGNIAMLKDQISQQKREEERLRSLVQLAINENDVTNGPMYAESLANLKTDLANNEVQLQKLEAWYKNNVDIIAESLRQVMKFQQDFEQLKIRVKLSRSQQAIAEMIKASTTELQGMVGGEASEAMQRMREAAFAGEGQITATVDLAQQMGSTVKMEQQARKARGLALFNEMKAQIAAQNPNAAEAAVQPMAAKQEKTQVIQVQQ